MNSFHVGRLILQLLYLTVIARLFPASLYEPEVRNYIEAKRYAKPTVDIGANSGYFTVLLASSSPFVFSIEPLPRNCNVIAQLSGILRVRNIRILQAAVSDRDAAIEFYVRPDNIGTIYKEQTDETVRVQSRTLTSLFKDTGGLSLIKVDAEGAEFAILTGAEGVISRVEEWIIEIHDPKEEPKISDFLKKKGYHCGKLSRAHLLATRRK